MLIAQIIVYAAILYLLIGVIFGAYFVVFKIGDFDAAAKGTGFGFRVLIFFGSVPLWSVLLIRLMKSSRPILENTAHRRAAGDSND